MQMAYDSTPSAETEDRAWLLTQMAHLNYVAGDLSKAEIYGRGALGLFPNYHYALGTLAQVRISQKRYDDAVSLLRTRYNAAPHAENLYALAEALELAGHTDESSKAFAEFESKSLAETNFSDNSNHELIAYYVDTRIALRRRWRSPNAKSSAARTSSHWITTLGRWPPIGILKRRISKSKRRFK